MNEETKWLMKFAERFGAGAQEALNFISMPENAKKVAKLMGKRHKGIPSSEPNDKIPDGVYFIAGNSDSEINTKTYARYAQDMANAPFPTKYIGVKLGQRAIAVALEDLPGDKDAELQLMPRNHTCPGTSEHYSCDGETDEYRFNAFEDFDGKNNTARLKSNGCKINLPDGEWIPSIGELGLLMMHAKDVNRAIELAGGKPIKGWHWSSTELSQGDAWLVYFSSGYTYYNSKYNSYAVRAVAAF